MSPLAPDIKGPDVFSRLAGKMREVIRQEHLNGCSGVELFTVRAVSPVVIESMADALVLHEGDPDFTIGQAFRQYALQYSLQAGDQVHVLRTDGPMWHLVDVVDPGGQQRFEFTGDPG